MTTEDEAWAILSKHGGGFEPQGSVNGDLEVLFRLAAKRTHPDNGGSHEDFIRVKAAHDFLRANL